MINHSIKKNLRLLAEKEYFNIIYEKEIIVFQKDDLKIKISNIAGDDFYVEYKDNYINDHINIDKKLIYHVVLKLFDFKKRKLTLEWKSSELLSMQRYYDVENFSQQEIQHQIDKSLEIGSFYKELGGNLIIAEYYRGIIILTDDLNFYNWNVIEWV